MSEHQQELRNLIEFCSQRCEAIFQTTGELLGMYHAVRENGEAMIIPTPPCDKDTGVRIIRKLFRDADVVQYVFVSEAWILTRPLGISAGEMEHYQKSGVSSHPDRIEAIIFIAENSDGTVLARRMIKRPEGRAAYLGPLIFEPLTGITEGRSVGLLPQNRRHIIN